MKEKIKIVFFGTPEFSVPILAALFKSGYEISAAVANPDEPAGRKKIPAPPPVKSLAVKQKVLVFQPEKLKNNPDFFKQLENLNPDLIVTAAYGKMIPQNILALPRLGAINVHPSLLPKYRGASPIQSTILNGEAETGVTIMKVDEEMDHGSILAKSRFPMTNDQTYETLSEKLMELGAELLIKTIPDYVSGKIKSMPQNDSEATYTKIIKKEDGKIDWSKSAMEIERMVRAYYPWPAAWTEMRLKNQKSKIKILESKILPNKNNYKIGEAVFIDGELAVKCEEGCLVIKKLQLEGRKVLSGREFLNGHRNFIGSVLG